MGFKGLDTYSGNFGEGFASKAGAREARIGLFPKIVESKPFVFHTRSLPDETGGRFLAGKLLPPVRPRCMSLFKGRPQVLSDGRIKPATTVQRRAV